MHSSEGGQSLIVSHLTDEQVRFEDPDGPAWTPRAPLHLPICLPVSDARAALAGADEAVALVTNRGVDVGVVTAEDLVHVPARALIRDVMAREVVCIDPSTDVRRTLRTYREAAWSSGIRRRPGRPRARSTPAPHDKNTMGGSP